MEIPFNIPYSRCQSTSPRFISQSSYGLTLQCSLQLILGHVLRRFLLTFKAMGGSEVGKELVPVEPGAR